MDIKKKEDIEHKLPAGKTSENYPYALSDKVFHTDQLFLYSEKVRPKTKASTAHNHRLIDEIIFVTKGELIAVEGENKVLLKQGDSVCFKAGTKEKHYLENQSDKDAEFLIFRRADISEDVVY